MGFVSLTMIEKTGIVFVTGMKPERKPVTFDMTLLIGTQGELKADWTTEWFYYYVMLVYHFNVEGGRGGYLCHKLELNDFSGVGLDTVWRKSKGAVGADLDDVDSHIRCCDGSSGEHEC